MRSSEIDMPSPFFVFLLPPRTDPTNTWEASKPEMFFPILQMGCYGVNQEIVDAVGIQE